LVPPDDPAALARALARLSGDPALRLRLGRAARARVLGDFGLSAGSDRLAARLGATLAAGGRAAA
jgi:glycosyltransferase involved in cell wall biosynthesis